MNLSNTQRTHNELFEFLSNTSNVVQLNVSKTNLKSLPLHLSDTLEELDCSDTSIEYIPKYYIYGLRKLICNNTIKNLDFFQKKSNLEIIVKDRTLSLEP